jgi:hypothetical protein
MGQISTPAVEQGTVKRLFVTACLRARLSNPSVLVALCFFLQFLCNSDAFAQ